jgi:Domain of unknown function (DUF4333)
MGMGGSRAAWGLYGALIVGGPGCGVELPAAALHDALTGWFGREGIALDAIDCPGTPLERAKGRSVECRVSIGAEVVEVTVAVTDDDGALAIRPRYATVIAARAEPEIAATLRTQGYAVAEVRCDGAVWVARPGAEHRCEVVDEDGRRYAWHGTWSGEGTRQRTRVVPLAAAGGAP